MPVVSVPPAVHAKLGQEASKELVEMLTVSHDVAGERYERRLASEMATLRVEMAGFRVEVHKELGGLRQEIARGRVELLKWMIVLWAGNLSAMVGMVVVMLRIYGH